MEKGGREIKVQKNYPLLNFKGLLHQQKSDVF
jgi:hypothetical protein